MPDEVMVGMAGAWYREPVLGLDPGTVCDRSCAQQQKWRRRRCAAAVLL